MVVGYKIRHDRGNLFKYCHFLGKGHDLIFTPRVLGNRGKRFSMEKGPLFTLGPLV